MYLNAVYSWKGTRQAEKSVRFVLSLKLSPPVSPRCILCLGYREYAWKKILLRRALFVSLCYRKEEKICVSEEIQKLACQWIASESRSVALSY